MPMSARKPTTELDWTLGDRILKVRKLLGMSQEDFAELFGVTEGAVSKWETDTSKPRDVMAFAARVETIGREHGLKVPAAWLLGYAAVGLSSSTFGQPLSPVESWSGQLSFEDVPSSRPQMRDLALV